MILNTLIYVLAVLLANYTTTPEWFIPLLGYGQVPLGTFVFGITFTQRDRLHQYGRNFVYWAIGLAAIANALMSTWLGIPVRIIVASFTAIVLAETADTEIYQSLRGRNWLTRVATSNAVSIPLDTLIFNGIAFLGTLSRSELLSLIYGDILIKFMVGLLVALDWQKGVAKVGRLLQFLLRTYF
jgi:hypothetical protein